MGNEMGNNNTTGLKEEENLTVEDPKEIASSVDEVKQENHTVVPDLEAKDFHGIVEDISIDKQIPKEDKEESGDFPLHDSPKVEADIKEESSETSDNQQAFLSNEAEDESLIELTMDEIVPNQLETQISSPKKENLSLDPISTSSSDDQVPEKHVESEDDRTIGSHGGTEQISRSSSTSASIGTEVLEDQEARVNTEPNDTTETKIDQSIVEPEKEILPEDKFEPSSFGEKSSELSSPRTSSIRDISSESESESEPKAVTGKSQQEVHETEEKFMLLTEQATAIDNDPCKDSDTFTLSESIAVEQNDLVSPFIEIRDIPSESESESEPKAVTPKSHQEVHETEEKFMFLTEQATSIDNDLSQDSDSFASFESITVEQKDLVSPCTEIDQISISPVRSDQYQQELAKVIVSINEVAIKQCIEKAPQAKEGVERVSTDSDRDSVQYAQMRKSPSFSIDLQDETRNEESDQIPLLFEDKAEIQSDNNGHSTDQHQAPIMALERSDSDESKTPFLNKEEEEDLEEESQIVITPTNQGIIMNSNVDSSSSISSIKVTVSSSNSSSSSKGNKEKRKFRPSLFGNCMCCTTVIN